MAMRHGKGAVALVLTAESVVRLRSKPAPESKVLHELRPGTRVELVEWAPPWQRVRTEKGEKGWTRVVELPSLDRLLDEVRWLDHGGELLGAQFFRGVLDRVPEVQRAGLLEIGRSVEPLQTLFDLARDAVGGAPGSLDAFAELLGLFTDCTPPPSRPEGFSHDGLSKLEFGSIRALAATGLPAPGYLPSPCLIPLPPFGIIGQAIFEAAWRFGRPGDDSFDDAVWAGLVTVDRLAGALRPLELVHRAVHRASVGDLPKAAIGRIAAAALGGCDDAGFARLPLVASAPPPGRPQAGDLGALGSVLGFPPIDLCRFLRWWEGTRALRCWCDEWYHIDRVVPCDDGTVVCPDECVEIRGDGFSPSRFLPGLEPPLGGGSTLRNKVFFQGDRGLVEATEFVPLPPLPGEPADSDGWSDRRIRVRVPAGARSGPVTLRILCRRPARAWPSSDYFDVGCGGRYRHRRVDRFHVGAGDAVTIKPPVHAQITGMASTGEVARADTDEAATLGSQACDDVAVTIAAQHFDPATWEVTDGDGGAVTPDSTEDLEGARVWRLTDHGPDSRTYRLTVGNECGPPVTRELSVARSYAVTAEPVSFHLLPGGTARGRARVSCPLSEGGVVRLELPPGFHGITLVGALLNLGGTQLLDLIVPRGERRTGEFELRGHTVDCGNVPMRYRLLSGHPEPHDPAVARIELEPQVIRSTARASVTVTAFPVDSTTPSRTFNSGDVTFNAEFSLTRDRVGFDFMGFDFAGNGLRRLNPTVPGVFDAARGDLTVDLDAQFGGPLIGETTGLRVFLSTFDASTGGHSRVSLPDGTVLDGAPFLRIHPRLDAFGILVGQGVGVGGAYNGQRIFVSLGIRIDPVPLACVER